jgi:multiple sugar transport system substrate-binding protein
MPAVGAYPDAVRGFPALVPNPDEVVRMTDVDRAIPATRTAIGRTERFAGADPERPHIEQLLNGTARPRTGTPADAEIICACSCACSCALSRTFAKIVLDRSPVGVALDRAVGKDLADHRYYPPTGP